MNTQLWKNCVRVLISLFAIPWSSEQLLAQDRVTYKPEAASSVITIVGEIISSTGEALEIHPTGSDPMRIPAGDVVEISTHYDPDHLEGIELFRSGRIEEAIDSFRSAMVREPRRWVDREILAWLVRCDYRLNDEATALSDFRQIIVTDPVTRHWNLAPLEWLPRQSNQQLSQNAKPLLVDTRAEMRLLGASHLLFDPDLSTTARREMDDLGKNLNPSVSALARAQLWRVALSKSEVSRDRLEMWQVQIDQMPAELRAGPQFLFARAHQQLGLPRLAAAEYLKLTIVYSENEPLTALATLAAAEALQQTGLTQGAGVLYRELLTRFPESTAAKQVQSASTAEQTSPSEATH